MICNLQNKIWPIDFNGESGQSGTYPEGSGSALTMLYELSKDLGLLPCPPESITLIGTIQYKWFFILWSCWIAEDNWLPLNINLYLALNTDVPNHALQRHPN